MLSAAAAPFYIPLSSAPGSEFLHTTTSTWCLVFLFLFCSSHPNECEVDIGLTALYNPFPWLWSPLIRPL